jgi:hypothetical protein
MRTKGARCQLEVKIPMSDDDYEWAMDDEARATRPSRSGAGRRPRRPGHAALLVAALVAGCSSGPTMPLHTAGGPSAPRLPVTARAAGSLVRVPRPDYSDPASVAEAFYIAWASVDALHDGPDTYMARCAPLVTRSLQQQLAASQPATAAWQAMRRDREISLVNVRAVSHPDGAPAPTSSVAYLRLYARRVTTTTGGRTTSSDGITVQLIRSGGRWLVSRLLFY